jgi:Restriction endonuclease S subunits
VEFIEKGIPLWKITIWDKRFNNVDNEWQPKTIKYNYLLSDELNSIKSEDGDVRILYTGKEVGYTTEELAGQNLSEGEIVSIPWGGIPSVKYHKGKFVTGDNRIATSSDVNRLTNKYLYYFLRGNIHEVASYYRGASLKHPNMKDILKMKISFPSIDIQEKICTQLDILESIIALRQKELLELDKLIRARFVEMFGDTIINSRGLNTLPMSEICEIIDGDRGKNYPTVDEFYDEGYCLFLNAKNVTSKGFCFDNCMFISKEKNKLLRNGKLNRGDIVLTTRGTLGNLAFYGDNIPFENIRINSGMVILRMRNDIMNEIYFIEQFKMQLEYIKKKVASGSAQPQLPISTMKKIQILIPDIEKQREFAEFEKYIDKSKVEVQKALDKAQLLFDSLMQKYFE